MTWNCFRFCSSSRGGECGSPPRVASTLPCQDLELVWKAKTLYSVEAVGFKKCGPCVPAMFTGSEREFEVNTGVGSQALGLRVEEIHS